MSKKAHAAEKAENTATPEVTPAETAANTTPTPTPEATSNLVTVNDLVLVVKFLEELANMKRLSEFEVQGIKPSFDRIVAFLQSHQAQTSAAEPVTQTQEELLDLPEAGKSKKKSSKKK